MWKKKSFMARNQQNYLLFSILLLFFFYIVETLRAATRSPSSNALTNCASKHIREYCIEAVMKSEQMVSAAVELKKEKKTLNWTTFVGIIEIYMKSNGKASKKKELCFVQRKSKVIWIGRISSKARKTTRETARKKNSFTIRNCANTVNVSYSRLFSSSQNKAYSV